jgi:hypothetical protein
VAHTAPPTRARRSANHALCTCETYRRDTLRKSIKPALCFSYFIFRDPVRQKRQGHLMPPLAHFRLFSPRASWTAIDLPLTRLIERTPAFRTSANAIKPQQRRVQLAISVVSKTLKARMRCHPICEALCRPHHAALTILTASIGTLRKSLPSRKTARFDERYFRAYAKTAAQLIAPATGPITNPLNARSLTSRQCAAT